MYSKKEEWTMMMTLLVSFFSSNYILRMYIESYTWFTISSIVILYIIGAMIITFRNIKNKN
jgi:hypothetical protein